MIKTKADLMYYIKCDRLRNIGNMSPIVLLLKSFYKSEDYISYNYLRTLRKYEYYYNYSKQTLGGVICKAYYKYKLHKLSLSYNIIIGPNMLGPGFKMPHIIGGGIVINCKSMGENCSANVNVLVGNKNGNESRPIIGNNVKLSTGCKIYGNISIGNNVIVAPNAVVCKDIPDNCIVGGIPARIIKRIK